MPDADTTEELCQQIAILRGMISQLPAEVAALLLAQVDKVWQQLIARQNALSSDIKEQLTDIELNVRYLQFDLEATRRERDTLQQRLDTIS